MRAQRHGLFSGGGSRVPGILVLIAASILLTPATARAFEDADVRAIVANAKDPADYPGSGGIWMARSRVVVIDGSGNAVITEHLLARVFDPAWGKATFSPFERTYSSLHTSLSLDHTRIWHSRSESIEVPRETESDSLAAQVRGLSYYSHLRTRRLSFPELKTGDVVEIRLVWTVLTPRDEYNTRWLVDSFGAEEPVVEYQVSVVAPRALNTYMNVLGPQVQRRTSDLEAGKSLRWLTGNLSPVGVHLLETPWSRMPFPGDSLSRDFSSLVFTTVKDWEALSDIYGPFWEAAWNLRTAEIDRVSERANASSSDLTERARYLERFVRDEIRTLDLPDALLGVRPTEAGLIMRAGAAPPRDKACLLVSLLRQAGVQAVPVLVRTRGGLWDPALACPDQLDRYLVRARILGRTELWLDPVGSAQVLPQSVGLIFPGAQEGRAFKGESGLIPFPGLPAAP